MGIPYSKQVNAAFEQVTPLVAAGFQVLHQTKNISILLALIQVLTVLLLATIQITLVILLITVNPDLDSERRAIVTPITKWIANRLIWWSGQSTVLYGGFWILVLGACFGASVGWYYTSEDIVTEAEADTAAQLTAAD